MHHIHQLEVRIEPFWQDARVCELRVRVLVDGDEHAFSQAFEHDDFRAVFPRMMECACDAITSRVTLTPPKKRA